eukprot:8904429-Pyramimonas_sp.AAC.1
MGPRPALPRRPMQATRDTKMSQDASETGMYGLNAAQGASKRDFAFSPVRASVSSGRPRKPP